jgi:H+-transporting ATPase
MDISLRRTADYENSTQEESLRRLGTSGNGLSQAEAGRRLALFGANEIAEERANPVLEFLKRFWGPMPWLLELAMGLSFLLHHILEGIIISVLLTVNAVIGHIHARGSQKAVELLKKKLAIRAKVLRDGEWVRRAAKEIVPGDIIAIGIGDVVPADAQIVSGDLSVDVSALTGESLPGDVRQSGIVYSSAVVRRGEAKCVVVNTGAHTYFGKTAELVKIARPQSHQEAVMMAVVKYMLYLGLGALVLVLAYGLAAHMPEHIVTVLTLAVIILMGTVPVALPAVLTIVQATGAMELAGKGALVTRLDSIEDAASIDVLCFDKTGTITQNRLSVADAVPFSGFRKEDVVIAAALASQQEGMDLIDRAVLEYADTTGVDLGPYRRVSFKPFDPSIKRTEAVIDGAGRRFTASKGAVEVVMALCRDLDRETGEKAHGIVREFSRGGFRTIAVARSDGGPDGFTFVGLLPMADPPRPESKGMIEKARALGIKPIMLTGDNAAIAKEIAGQVGIGRNIMRMADVRGLSDAEQIKLVGECSGFAEIYPEDKYNIVKLLQSRGHMVGMTGDGVNDAPALKQAEMGIAVSNATDVAKASASVVLTEPGIGVIVNAVIVSRQTYQRMLTWVLNKVTKVIEFVALITLGFVWLQHIVLSLLGMSLLVFANDFVTMSLATDRVTSTPNPNIWNVRNITLASLVPGMLFVLEDLLVIIAGRSYLHLPWEHLQTFILLALIFNSQFRVQIVRERRHFWSSLPGRELLLLSLATIAGFSLLAVYGAVVPALAPGLVLAVLAFSALCTLGIDFPKYYVYQRFGL